MWMFLREMREREGSIANGRGMRRGGGGVSAIMNVDEDEKLMEDDSEENQDQ